MPGIGHSAAPRGKRVLVILKSGERIVDKFVERTDRELVLEQRGRVAKADVRSFSIYMAGATRTEQRRR